MIYPVFFKQFVDDPSIKTLYIKDTEKSRNSLIPVRYRTASNYAEYKEHLYNKYGREVVIDDEIENIVCRLGEVPVYGRGDAVFLVALSNDPNTETLACAMTDSDGNTRLVIHPECTNGASTIKLNTFFGENTCLEAWFGRKRIESLYLIERRDPVSFDIFDAEYNSLVSAEVYENPSSTLPLHKGLYNFNCNPFIDENQRFIFSLCHHDQSYKICTDRDFLEQNLTALKPQELPHYIPFYLTT